MKDIRQIESEEIVWESFDSSDGERTMKEHAFKNRVIEHWYENYIGATALCDKTKGGSEDGETYLSTDQIAGTDTPKMLNTCKKCLKIWKNLTSNKQ
jgi:hypothetical protein